MSTENKVVFKKGPLYRKSTETDPGILFFATDAGRLFLNTAQGQSIEIHSDLPYGVLGSENNNITVDKPVVLGNGVSINVYGSRIPVQLNINNTGARNVKLNGATLSAAQVLEGNTIITYTYVQSENAWIAGSVPGNSSSGDSAKKYKFGLTFSNETNLSEGMRLYTLNSLNGYLTSSPDYAAELLSLYTDISTDPTSVSITINDVPSYVQAMGGGAYALISNMFIGELPLYLVSALVSYEDGSGNTVAIISAQYIIGQEVPSNTILSIDAYTSIISQAIIQCHGRIDTSYVGGILVDDKYPKFNKVVIDFLRDGVPFSEDRIHLEISGSQFSVSDVDAYTVTLGAVDYTKRTLIFSGSVYGRRCDIAFEIHPESEREDYIKKGYYVLTQYNVEEDVDGTPTQVTYYLMYSVVTRNRIYELTVDNSPTTSNNKSSYQFIALDGYTSNSEYLDRCILDIQKALSPEKYGVALNTVHMSDGQIVYDTEDTKSKSDICINVTNSNGEKVCLYPRYYDNTKCIFCSDVVDTTTGAPVQDPTLQMYNGLVFTLTVTYPTNYGTLQVTHAVVSNLELLELLGQGGKVTANPTLVGGESNLTSLQIGSTKYSLDQGTGIKKFYNLAAGDTIDYDYNFYEVLTLDSINGHTTAEEIQQELGNLYSDIINSTDDCQDICIHVMGVRGTILKYPFGDYTFIVLSFDIPMFPEITRVSTALLYQEDENTGDLVYKLGYEWEDYDTNVVYVQDLANSVCDTLAYAEYACNYDITSTNSYSSSELHGDCVSILKAYFEHIGSRNVRTLLRLSSILKVIVNNTLFNMVNYTYDSIIYRGWINNVPYIFSFKLDTENTTSTIPAGYELVSTCNVDEDAGTYDMILASVIVPEELEFTATFNASFNSVTAINGVSATPSVVSNVANNIKRILDTSNSTGSVPKVLIHGIDANGTFKACFTPNVHFDTGCRFVCSASGQAFTGDADYASVLFYIVFNYPVNGADGSITIDSTKLLGYNANQRISALEGNTVVANQSLSGQEVNLTALTVGSVTYSVVSKSYVDNSIASAISAAIGGSY